MGFSLLLGLTAFICYWLGVLSERVWNKYEEIENLKIEIKRLKSKRGKE